MSPFGDGIPGRRHYRRVVQRSQRRAPVRPPTGADGGRRRGHAGEAAETAEAGEAAEAAEAAEAEVANADPATEN
ncbi:MAG: hypothetical protein PHQ28_15745 [Mycobacterium sp.]|nr:hypothetical protein [Mycobacterium sp.]